MKHLLRLSVVLLITTTAFASAVTLEQAQIAATNVAESVWETVNLLESATLLSPDGSISAYAFTFGRNGTETIREANVLAGYELRQAGMEEQGWELACDPESYAYVIVASDDHYGPILEMCDGLPAHHIFQYDVNDLGEEILGMGTEISTWYYLAPLENWFAVVQPANQQRVFVNPRRQLTVSADAFTTFETVYDRAVSALAPVYWNALLEAPLLQTDDQGYIGGVPNYNQTSTDCGPHSAAQAVGYWDNHTYGGYGPWDLLIDVDFWGLRDEMRMATGWVPGGGVTDPQIQMGILMVCNDPAFGNNYSFDAILYSTPVYANCSNAIAGGRPGVVTTWNHPYYGAHAMTLVGYNDTPTQMLQVHDNWPPSTDEPWIAFDATIDGYINIFPGGGGPVTPIVLQSLTGEYQDGCVELIWTVASETNCLGYQILRSSGESFSLLNQELIRAENAASTRTYSFRDEAVTPGNTYTYTLQTHYLDGRQEASAQVSVAALEYALKQNSPNPFNATTTIHYEVPVSGFVTLMVYDLAGCEIATLVQEQQAQNAYQVNFDASRFPSGIYLYRYKVGTYQSVKKMILLK